MKPKEVAASEKSGKKQFKKEYVLVIIISLILVVFILFSGKFNTSENDLNNGFAANDYAENLEDKLEKVLSSIEGAGKVEVLVTVDGTSKEIVLKDVETKIENGVKTTVESIILIGGKPYVTMTQNPKVISVSVVCEGADNLEVKLSITEIITNSLSVSADNVRIIKMK